MKYILDILLVVALLWIGNLWNKEHKNGLAQGDEIEKRMAQASRLEQDLEVAKEAGAKSAGELETAKADLIGAQGEVERLGKEVQDKVDALGAKEAEATELHASLAAAVARVKELEGYKAKAIVAEMPKPAAPAPAAP